MKRPPGYIPPDRAGIPVELVALDRWVAWRFAPRVDKETGEIKPTKEPINPGTGGLAKTDDPSTWGTLDAAWERYERDQLDGVGFVLNGEELVGIDIDHCRDAETGVIDPEANEVIEQIGSYSEASPSGTGARIFLHGRLPPEGRKRGRYEMYVTGRYLTVTGARINGCPSTIEDRPNEVLALHQRIFGEKGKAKPERKRAAKAGGGPGSKRKPQESDAAADDYVIDRARSAKSGKKFAALFDKGDWSSQGYSSRSEADLALCSFLMHAAAGEECIDRLFRRSKLMRKKWDEVHCSEGLTYGQMTIAKAVTGYLGDDQEEEERTYHPVNAGHRMVRLHGDDLLYCGGEWRVYDGKRWLVDTDMRVERITREVVETYAEEAARIYAQADEKREELESETDLGRKEALEEELERIEKRANSCWGFYLSMSRPKGIKDISVAASWDLTCQLPELDADPYLLNVQNGTVDLRTGEVLPHRKCDLITKLAASFFEPHVISELWTRYLNDAFGDDTERRTYVQRAMGSALIGLQLEDLIILLVGPGGTGKSTLLEACRRSIGDYGKPVPFEIFLERRHSGGTTPELAALPGVRMVTSAEAKESVGFDVARLKMLSGGDEIMANPKYLKPFEFDPVFTIVLATNYAPKATGSDTALWRRLRVIRFDRVVRKQDKKLRLHLAGKIRGVEADPRHQAAVLAWLIQGARDYIEFGLGDPPESVVSSTESTRREMDPLWAFLKDECVLDPTAWTLAETLWTAYQRYATERGMTLVDDAAWGMTLNTFGATPRRRNVGRGWEGIRLRDAAHDAGHDAAPEPENRPGDGQEGGFSTP